MGNKLDCVLFGAGVIGAFTGLIGAISSIGFIKRNSKE
jgi:hypothetical protein